MGNKELLRFDDVSYSIGTKNILSDINWVIREGEQWALLGPNGAGKSTLLNLVYGFLWPNRAGIISRNGEEHVNLGELRKSIGLVSSDLRKRIPRGETVLETVLSGTYAMLGYWMRKSDESKEDTTKAMQIMETLGIVSFQKRAAQTLSHGEFQKVLLARALMSEPYLILMDEPLEGLDPGAQENFLDVLSAYIKKHTVPSFVYVTHHVDEIISEFQKVIALKNGKIMFQGNIKDGMSSAFISRLYDYAFDVIQEDGRYRMKRAKALLS